MLNPDFFLSTLAENAAGIPVSIELAIKEQALGQAVVASNGIDVRHYARLGHATVEPLLSPAPSAYRYWGGEDFDQLYWSYDQMVWRVEWQEKTLHLLHMEWVTGCGNQSRDWVIAENAELADAFILDVERKTHAPGESILVFADGRWSRSKSLYQATQSASFDDLVLADDLKETLRGDFRNFLDAEETYQRLGIAWRRGALLTGPPGNGKTHCVRALVREIGIACLYVKSLEHRHYTPEQVWQMVFERARGLRPCLLVLEDLDSLLNRANRSFFLNQLDGFERNHGLLVLATTNHPERIDAAIIDRPSRFDRKYHFALPTPAQRRTFLEGWREKLATETGWAETSLDGLAETTGGFSFAYLKELVISAVMQWLQDIDADFASVIAGQADLLKQQVASENADTP